MTVSAHQVLRPRGPNIERLGANRADVHLGALIGARQLRRIVARIQALDPDLVVSTGDLVDGTVPELAGMSSRRTHSGRSRGSRAESMADRPSFGEENATHGSGCASG